MIRTLLALGAAFAGLASAQPPTLDFEFFKAKIEPIFLKKRPGHARCYVCHSTGTTFRLERLSPGATTWNEEQSRRNFDSAKRLVSLRHPLDSRLLTHPLAPEAGGDEFHSGGKHWNSRNDPEWQAMADWVNGAQIGVEINK